MPTLEDVRLGFKEHMNKLSAMQVLAPGTVYNYICIVEKFLREHPEALNPEEFPSAVEAYVAANPRYPVVAALKHLGSYLNYPFPPIKTLNRIVHNAIRMRGTSLPTYVGFEYYVDLALSIQPAPEAGLNGLKDPRRWEVAKAIACMQVLTGARAMEVITIKRLSKTDTQIRANRKRIEVAFITKGAGLRTVVIKRAILNEKLQMCYDYVLQHLNSSESGYPFTMPGCSFKSTYRRYYDVLKYTAEHADLPIKGSHDFRRAVITHLLERGVNVASVQEFIGHASPAQTLKYDRRRLSHEQIYRVLSLPAPPEEEQT